MFDASTKILIVDDMMTMRKVVIKACKSLGFTDFTEAKDGLDAWKKLSESPEPIQLIISDWNMPNSSGLDFLKKIRADAKFAKLPFVLLTAESEASQVKEAIMAGVDNYITKPFSADVLKERLETVHQKQMKAAA